MQTIPLYNVSGQKRQSGGDMVLELGLQRSVATMESQEDRFSIAIIGRVCKLTSRGSADMDPTRTTDMTHAAEMLQYEHRARLPI